MPVWPCVPTTISSALRSAAAIDITSPGGPMRLTTSVSRPAPRISSSLSASSRASSTRTAAETSPSCWSIALSTSAIGASSACAWTSTTFAWFCSAIAIARSSA
jgi:hypothetical protein